MPAAYQQDGLILERGSPNDPALVRALQHDLRALGYLHSHIDGAFGEGTQDAIKALEYDLMHNDGTSSGGDGNAPVKLQDFNRFKGNVAVTAITGRLEQALAHCLAALMADPKVTKLPSSSEPVEENRRALAAIASIASAKAPTPFIAAMTLQESGGRHFRVPTATDKDDFVVVGLDRNHTGVPEHITSRGYGMGQYTIFHHPSREEEVRDFILDPMRNVQRAFTELREKFDRFVTGHTPATRADDRIAERHLLPMSLCRYAPGDVRYMKDCRTCALAAKHIDIQEGRPLFDGSSDRYRPTEYYASATYHGVPDRADFLCDWPYAARRYNGSGVNSFHYQARILLNLSNA